MSDFRQAIDLDAIKAAGLNSDAHSMRMLEIHHAQERLEVHGQEHKPGRWVTYKLPAICHSFARFPGVYAVCFGDEIVYVGQSIDVGQRLASHKFRHAYSKEYMTPWGDLSHSTPLTVKVKRSRVLGDWLMWEIRLIARLRPRFNMQHRARVSA